MNVEAENLACREILEHTRGLLEGGLEPAHSELVRAHVERCAGCRKELDARRKVMDLLGTAFNGRGISGGFETQATRRLNTMRETGSAAKVLAPSTGPLISVPIREEALAGQGASEGFFSNLAERFGSAPWWMISTAFHVLMIALLGLITMAIGTPGNNEVVIVASIERTPQIQPMADVPKKADALRDVLESRHETPATDPNSNVASDIVVPPDILAKAELGDHFETVNPDRPDTHSAFGNPDARMFHSVLGNDEPEGGGGSGGLSLSDDLIGVGGATSPGAGGGWGGGNGTGTGIGNGSGHGSFGQRNGGGRRLMVMRHGGNKATESAVDKGLDWLARNQEADGHWDAFKHEAHPNYPHIVNGQGDVAMTGFAMLAFLGAGHTDRVGKYKDNVKRAAAYLIDELEKREKQVAPGRWFSNNYVQGVATLALAELAGMTRDAKFRAAAQRAADQVTAGQIKKGESEYEAWDYAPGGVTNDTSVSGWNVMALKSAKVAGLKVNMNSFEGAINWCNMGQDMRGAPKAAQGTFDWEGGKMPYRGTKEAPNMGTERTPAMTAVCVLIRLFTGDAKPEDPTVAGPCNLMLKPERQPAKWPGNLYYWYYGTLIMFQKGGDYWKTWNQNMRKTLPDAQRKDGQFDGSWDPLMDEVGGFIYGGRVMSTSLAIMCLEVYYRYLPLYR